MFNAFVLDQYSVSADTQSPGIGSVSGLKKCDRAKACEQSTVVSRAWIWTKWGARFLNSWSTASSLAPLVTPTSKQFTQCL